MPPSGAPNDPVAVDTDDVVNDADARIDVRHDEHPQEPQREAAITVIAAPPKAIPQNAEDLRAGYPLLAPIIDANEQAFAAEDEDPLWSTAMETRIVNEISQKALGLEITDLQVGCRTTLCRVEMTFPLQLAEKKFEPFTQDTAWNGRQPVMFFVKALDLDFRDHVAAGLNRYGTPVMVGYVNRPPEKTNE